MSSVSEPRKKACMSFAEAGNARLWNASRTGNRRSEADRQPVSNMHSDKQGREQASIRSGEGEKAVKQGRKKKESIAYRRIPRASRQNQRIRCVR